MENDDGLTVWTSAYFPVHEISVAAIEHAVCVRLEFWVERCHEIALLLYI